MIYKALFSLAISLFIAVMLVTANDEYINYSFVKLLVIHTVIYSHIPLAMLAGIATFILLILHKDTN